MDYPNPNPMMHELCFQSDFVVVVIELGANLWYAADCMTFLLVGFVGIVPDL